jgi:hypothetical protein
MSIDHVEHYWSGPGNDTIHLDQSYNNQNSYSYSQKSQTTWGLGYSLESSLQVEGIGPKVTYSAKFERMTESGKDWSSSQSAGFTWKLDQIVAAGYTVKCQLVAAQGTFNADYDANVAITLKNGKTFSYRENGTKNKVLYTETSSSCHSEQGDTTSGASKRKEDNLVPVVFSA